MATQAELTTIANSPARLHRRCRVCAAGWPLCGVWRGELVQQERRLAGRFLVRTPRRSAGKQQPALQQTKLGARLLLAGGLPALLLLLVCRSCRQRVERACGQPLTSLWRRFLRRSGHLRGRDVPQQPPPSDVPTSGWMERGAHRCAVVCILGCRAWHPAATSDTAERIRIVAATGAAMIRGASTLGSSPKLPPHPPPLTPLLLHLLHLLLFHHSPTTCRRWRRACPTRCHGSCRRRPSDCRRLRGAAGE